MTPTDREAFKVAQRIVGSVIRDARPRIDGLRIDPKDAQQECWGFVMQAIQDLDPTRLDWIDLEHQAGQRALFVRNRVASSLDAWLNRHARQKRGRGQLHLPFDAPARCEDGEGLTLAETIAATSSDPDPAIDAQRIFDFARTDRETEILVRFVKGEHQEDLAQRWGTSRQRVAAVEAALIQHVRQAA